MIITIANMKGGTGKTTTANALALGYTRCGYKVLLIDACPQANATRSSGVTGGPSLSTVICGTPGNAIQRSSLNYDLLAGENSLSALEIHRLSPLLLEMIIKSYSNLYDYIFIDTPLNITNILSGALSSCDKIIIPTQPEGVSFSSTLQFMSMLHDMHHQHKVLGILATFYQNTKLHNGALQVLEKRFSDMVFQTKIRRSIAIAEAQTLKRDLYEYAPMSSGAKDYGCLINEINEKLV